MRRILGAIVLVLSASTALAQQVPGLCGERSEMHARIKGQYGEQPTQFTAVGVGGAGVDVLTSDSGSWTVLLSLPDGRSCLIDHANAGENRPLPPLGRNR
jgi:hypothetical protein